MICQVFLLCGNEATTEIDNVVLGKVPCCQRCKDKMEPIAKKTKVTTMDCKFCNETMTLEDSDFCCDNCGATYAALIDAWTEPVVPKCEVSTPKK